MQVGARILVSASQFMISIVFIEGSSSEIAQLFVASGASTTVPAQPTTGFSFGASATAAPSLPTSSAADTQASQSKPVETVAAPVAPASTGNFEHSMRCREFDRSSAL